MEEEEEAMAAEDVFRVLRVLRTSSSAFLPTPPTVVGRPAQCASLSYVFRFKYDRISGVSVCVCRFMCEKIPL